jgi:hypothetical protein
MVIKSNLVYDILKRTSQVVLPAIGALYFALSQIWGLPNGEQVVGTIIALDAFLGITLNISSTAYNKSDERFDGTIDIFEDENTKQFVLNVDGDPYDIENKDEIVLKVKTL